MTDRTHDPEVPFTERRALDLIVGDVIDEPGSIALAVTSVGAITHGFVVVHYHAGPNGNPGDEWAGHRAYPALQCLRVRRRSLDAGARPH